MTRHVYVSHPEVRIDPAVPVPRWGLSDRGAERTMAMLAQPWLGSLRRVVASGETKAIETAGILARELGLDVEIAEDTHENDRSATGFLPPAEFEEVADAFFAAPETSVRGWERAIDAQARIVAAVRRLVAERPDTATAFVGHGGVGTLLWCHLAHRPISRAHDQRGGGNYYRFTVDGSAPLPWRAIDAIEERST